LPRDIKSWKNSYNGEMGEQEINYSMQKFPKISPQKGGGGSWPSVMPSFY